MVFTQTSNWDMENSFQHTWLTGDVAGWFTIPVSSTNCDTNSIKSDALSAAQSAGYNLSSYSHFVYLMSSNTGCSSWWGLASVGGGDVWVNTDSNSYHSQFAAGSYAFMTLMHELGHALGLKHPHEAILRQRTSSPTRCAVVFEPVVRELMMNVVGIEQRHENIHVEQRRADHGSSSSSSTIRVVTIRPGWLGKSGTPFRTWTGRAG